MKLETTMVIGNVQVEDTGYMLLGHKVFKEKPVNGELLDLKLYFVSNDGTVVSSLVVKADYGQCVGYVSDWGIIHH